jgi:hypothetical protein
MSLWDALGEGPTTTATSGSDSSQTSRQQTGTQTAGTQAQTGASTSLSNIADWVRPYAQDALAMGRSVAGKEYTKYNPANVGEYMNPYIDQTLAPTIRNINEASADEMAGIGSKARQIGAFGGSRQAILESEADQNRLQQIGDATASAYDQAFKTAQGIDLDEFRRGENWESERLRDYLGTVSGVPMDRSTSTQDVSQASNLSEVMQMLQSEQKGTERGFGNEQQQSGTLGTLGGIAGLASSIAGLFPGK